jgi:hypothetical protein
VLDRCEGNKREACRALDISYHTLQSYLRFPVHDPAASADAASAGGAPEVWREDADAGDAVEVESAV